MPTVIAVPAHCTYAWLSIMSSKTMCCCRCFVHLFSRKCGICSAFFEWQLHYFAWFVMSSACPNHRQNGCQNVCDINPCQLQSFCARSQSQKSSFNWGQNKQKHKQENKLNWYFFIKSESLRYSMLACSKIAFRNPPHALLKRNSVIHPALPFGWLS